MPKRCGGRKTREQVTNHRIPQLGYYLIITDKIIFQAQKNKVHVGWSNPCIEIWFHAYWHTMPVYTGSVACCSGFAREYQKQTGQKYEKANPSIYAKLCEFGNEAAAIALASSKLDEHKHNCKQKPSEMCPCTTLHQLISEIKGKIEHKATAESDVASSFYGQNDGCSL
ncbi:MAG: RloB domain-containing protein [Clostridia bacterium]